MTAPPANTLQDARHAPRERLIRLAALLIILAGLAAYANSLSNAFVFDDIDEIASNAAIQHLWPPWKFFWPLNRPILNLSLAASYALSPHGPSVVSYHLFNIAVHVLAALTLFGLVRRTLLNCRLPIADCRMITEKDESTANVARGEPLAVQIRCYSTTFGNRHPSSPAEAARRATKDGSEIACWLAFATALIWEVHPLQTESVTYIIQRAESLAGLFYLLTVYCVMRGALSGRPRHWYAAAFAACALGLGTKQTVATAPLVALLYDRIFLSGSFRETLRRRWPLYVALAATWLLVVPSILPATGAQRVSAGFQMPGVGPLHYAATQLGVILHYLRLSFWPAGLCLDYNWPPAKGIEHILPGAVIIGALLAATVAALVLRPRWGFLGAWFFLTLAPSSSFVPIADAAAEHRMYLSLAAVVALVVIGGYVLLSRLPGNRRLAPTAAAAAVFLIAAVLGVLTAVRNRDYRSELTIWADTVRKAPDNPRALDGLGKAYFAKGDYARALEHHAAAIRANPNYAPAFNGRAIVYNELRQFDQALKDCDEAVRLDPNYFLFHNTRAVVLARMGRYDAALREYSEAIRLNPYFAEACMNRGVSYEKIGAAREDSGFRADAAADFDKAIADFDTAIALKADYPSALYNRGNTYADLDDYDRAISDYSRAIALKPDYRDAYYNRAVAWFCKKDYRRSWEDIRALRRLGGEAPPGFLQALTQAAPQN